MKITIGEWKTRGGRKAIVAAENDSACEHMRMVGWIESFAYSWSKTGRHRDVSESMLDLIAPWTDPVPWDWSTTPPWINWIAMDEDGLWYLFDEEPTERVGYWDPEGSSNHQIPSSHHPKWNGDWKLSKTMRPKEVTK